MSPTQTAGAISLTPEVINARFSYYDPDTLSPERKFSINSSHHVFLSPPLATNVQDAQREQQNSFHSNEADEASYVIYADGGDGLFTSLMVCIYVSN
jgi:hypothetical protein